MRRILVISEFTELSTGYSVYCKNLIRKLFESNKYEVAELATYCEVGEPRIANVPWKVYPVIPHPHDTENRQIYDAQANGGDPQVAFGKGVFNHVLLDFKPDVVCTITDFWYCNFIDYCPYRHCFNWVHMPTVDALNQKYDWKDVYSRCDALLTYTDWSKKVLEDEGGLFSHGEATPAASEHYYPMNQAKCKESFGINPETNIIGMISRNQRRKLYPDLISSFSKWIHSTGRKDTLLLLHSAWPDNQGWDFPRIIMENQVCKYVLLTYICGNCQSVWLNHFSGQTSVCPRCNDWSCVTSSVGGMVNDLEMARIFNTLDLCVQWANSEGCGIAPIQAAACGTPVIEVDYSAMDDVVRKLGGEPIAPLTTYEEIETGCLRAIPDNKKLIEQFDEFFSLPTSLRQLKRLETREHYTDNYSWDKATNKWVEVIDKVPRKNWNAERKVHAPAEFQELDQLTNYEYAHWLMTEVLGEPERIGTSFELSLISDLNYGQTNKLPGMYFIEDSHQFFDGGSKPFSRRDAYDTMRNMCESRNEWETNR